MDLLGKLSLFTFIILGITQEHLLVSAQSCLFDNENSFLNVEANEFSELGSIIGNFWSAASVVDIEEVGPPNQYIKFDFRPVAGRLDILLNASLKEYFRDPKINSDTFVLDKQFRAICADGSSTIHTLIVQVIDQNEQPVFEDPSKDTFEIQYPWDLNVPINYDTDIFTVDWDFREDFSNQIIYTTSEPQKIIVEVTHQWDSTTPRPRRNSLKLKLLEQLSESLTFNVIATDYDLAPVEKTFTIHVTPINCSPPKFEEHFYKADIPDFPKMGDPISLNGHPLKISIYDKESNTFSVTTNSDLIAIEEYPLNPGSYFAYFTRDVTEDDLSSFDRGVGLIDIIAKEIGPDGEESSALLLLYFNKVTGTTELTESTTFDSIKSTQELEETCPPCPTPSTVHRMEDFKFSVEDSNNTKAKTNSLTAKSSPSDVSRRYNVITNDDHRSASIITLFSIESNSPGSIGKSKASQPHLVGKSSLSSSPLANPDVVPSLPYRYHHPHPLYRDLATRLETLLTNESKFSAQKIEKVRHNIHSGKYQERW